jgi:predicted negative regulator of RcsB-dependent stress response
VSFGISEAVVELFVLAVALFIGWRVWRFVQRRRRSRPA